MSTQIIGRTPEGISLLTLGSQDQQPLCGSGAPILCSEDGSKLVALGPGAVKLVDVSTAQEASSLPEDAVVLSAFSSTGAYLVTAQRPGKAQDGSLSKNLKVWELASGKCLFSIAHKQVAKDTWPVLHWTPDDSAFVYMVTNTVHVYSRADSFATYRKVTIKGIGGVALSPVAAGPGGLPQLAAFLPEAKGTPAGAGLYSLEGSGPTEPTATVRKSFFRSQGAKLMWNSLGTACLVLSYADYDATNQSYYGEQKLHYLPADPAKADEAVTVPLPKEGPVHDVQWSPAGDYFIAVAGFMPAKVTLFSAACKPVYDLGSGPYNMVRWNPFGRFFAICGFGNLPGDIMLFDKKTSGTCKQMGAVRSPAVSAEWSPCGRLLLTATTAPRLRVDNNIKVFTYYGEQKAHVPFATLLDAAWRPVAKGAYQDRPQSPERLSAAAKGEVATSAPTKPSYVPPHLRAAGVTSTAAASSGAKFSLARDDDDRPGKISAAGGRKTALPPGAEFIAGGGNSKAASKNAKRRAKKKGGEASGEGDDGEEGAGGADGAEAAAAAMASTSLQDAQPLNDEESRQKRIRALQKKQRQIQELKDKRAAGATMTPEQLEKLAGEEAILSELASLGA
ncbi:hypothetical protein HYH02_013844 [Chlamydomonas schloesseri]|uniref:Eukaryotic translation initiation factor 2A n=1 Tax=Chlamydomonas schloesseri TaxID=2026947 RepID=A0A835VYT3_9CHLO|nr:hypothetical protein HYH02_013844 [Chlamydomonas schloesseri]|eukprot:KAG2430016.1 hypothetical protein HYH02_013844 [Chlamydomonas schloesseri]